MCVRKEAGLEPETSDSTEQRRQKALPSPVQVLSARKFLGAIDISGAVVPLSQFLLFRSALPTWLPCPLLALTGTAETQLGLVYNTTQALLLYHPESTAHLVLLHQLSRGKGRSRVEPLSPRRKLRTQQAGGGAGRGVQKSPTGRERL